MTDRLELAPSVRFRRVLDEGVVLLQRQREILGVSESGIRILELVREGLGPAEIAAELAREFDASPAAIRADVDRFVAEMVEAGALQERSGDRE